MKVSTKGRYALRLMLDLAVNGRGEPVRLREVASRQQISEKYLEQIISILNRAGFVSGIRGAQGGYRLERDPAEYTVGMILRLTEKDLSPVGCVGENPADCGRRPECVTVRIWEQMNEAVNQVVDGITLADLAGWQQEKEPRPLQGTDMGADCDCGCNGQTGQGSDREEERQDMDDSGAQEAKEEGERFSRTELLLGRASMDRLKNARIAVFGIGGVGGYVCEALARSGIGAFDLVDHDRVAFSNLNRQIIATEETVGQYKVEAMRERILSINPGARVRIYRSFFLPENAGDFPFQEYDYVVDAVDTVTAKIALVMTAREKGVPIISSMGAGNKLEPGRFQVADIYQTRVCPLARVMRRELKKRGVKELKVVYSQEEPVLPVPKAWPGEDEGGAGEETKRRSIPGSTAFVPSVAGLILAGEVVKDLCGRP